MGERLLIAVLAAGASRRLGQPKQLVKIGGEPLVRRQCRVALESQIGPVAVILGCQASLCAQAITDLSVIIRSNEQWEEGLASSIREAARTAVGENASGLLILHVDQYRVTAQDLQRLHAAWSASEGRKGCRARHNDYIGPPVIFPAACLADLLRLAGGDGARQVIAQFGPDSIVDVGMPGAAYDLDLPAQLADVAATPDSM